MVSTKLRIALFTVLITLLLAAPAFATDKTLYTTPNILKDDNGITITIDHVQVSDLPAGYSVFNYPPSQYQFYTIYYVMSNPTNDKIRYQFHINFVDDKGRVFTSEEYNLAEWMNPDDRSTLQPKEFAVYRNASGLHLEWKHINHYWNNETIDKIALSEDIAPTKVATPTSGAAASSTPTATTVPTPTATPAPSSQPCLPFLPMAVIAGGFGTAGLLFQRLAGRR